MSLLPIAQRLVMLEQAKALLPWAKRCSSCRHLVLAGLEDQTEPDIHYEDLCSLLSVEIELPHKQHCAGWQENLSTRRKKLGEEEP